MARRKKLHITESLPSGIRRRGSTLTAYWWVPGSDGIWRQRSKGGFPATDDGLNAAAQHREKQVAAIDAGTYNEPREKTLTVRAFLVEHWLPAARTSATRSGERRRASTIATYEVAVTAWLVPHLGGRKVASLTPVDVENALKALRVHGGKERPADPEKPDGPKVRGPLGDRSVQVAHGVLRQALDWGLRQGYVTRNVASLVDRPGARSKETTAWSPTEASSFLSAVRGDRLFAMWLLALTRGLRRGELAGLRWSDVDLDAGQVSITHTRVSIGGRAEASSPKTAGSRRSVALDPSLVAALREHRRAQLELRMAWGPAYDDGGWVFSREDGAPLHPESISQRFDRLCTRVGARRIRLHDLRHTTATLLLAQGTPVKVVSELLGHADVRVTLAIYQHTTPDQHAAAGAALTESLLAGPA